MIMGMGIFVGGLAQVLAGTQEWKKNNTLGATAFTAYGFFWMALVATWVMPTLGLAAKSAELDMGFFLAIWGGFTTGMFFGTLRMNRALQVVFGTLADWVGIVCGFSALYAAIAQVLNEVYGNVVMSLGVVRR